MEQDKRHIPHASGEPHNAQTKPADTKEVDKLRENPHNDERTISQSSETPKPAVGLNTGSTFARKDEGRNQVTNEEEQNQVVNPEPGRVENKAGEEEPEVPGTPDSPEEPSTNPYEEIGDDPDTAKKKLPKM
ncbi:MAG: hypothetical protein WCF67_15170 [Chitinophagaceae bacterium]